MCPLEQPVADEQIPSSCEKSPVVEGCEDVETLDLSPDKAIAGNLPHGEVWTIFSPQQINAECVLTSVLHLLPSSISLSFVVATATCSDFVHFWLIQRRKGITDTTATDHEPLSVFDHRNSHSKSERSLCDECKELEMGFCTEDVASSESPSSSTSSSSGSRAGDVRRQPFDVDYSKFVGPKVVPPVGGRVRILRHLRCEVAYVVDKYCKGKPKAVMTFEQFELLYELEMGHPLVTSHYGFASLKSILQSMPDLLSVRTVSFDAADWRIFPYIRVRKFCSKKVMTVWLISH